MTAPDHFAAALREAAASLRSAGIPDEALATFRPEQAVLRIFTRPSKLTPLARVWRLGVFLLGTDGALFDTGSTTRAVPPGRAGYQSISAEERRDVRAAAYRGPFPEGSVVHHSAAPIALDDSLRDAPGPLFLHGDALLVRWADFVDIDGAVPAERYLAERLDLLRNPPGGA